MGYKAAIFDLDGTLVHTSAAYRLQLTRKALKDLGVGPSNPSSIDKFWFSTNREEIIGEHFRVNSEDFWKAFEKYDQIDLRIQHTLAYPDFEYVKEIKKQGYKTGIVTAAPVHIAEAEIGLLGFEYFDAIIMARESQGIKKKPHPEGLERCLELIKVRKDEAFFVGNADEDILTAKNAGVFDVLIKRGEHEIPDVDPSLSIESLYELRQLTNSA